jgi:hypothetical protein
MTKTLNTRTISEMSRIGAPLTGDLESILLRDPESLQHKAFQTALIESIENEIDLDHLAHLFAVEKQREEALEALELEEAQLEKSGRERQYTPIIDHKPVHPATTTDSTTPDLGIAALMIEFLRYNHTLNTIRDDVRNTQIQQEALKEQWQAEQANTADNYIHQLHHVPVLLPNGQATNLALEFDVNSLEAAELRERLAGAPMTADLLDKLAHTHVREMYNKQVQLQELNIRNRQPSLVNNPDRIELLARQQAIFDLNIDTRELQNKFILSIPAIHRHMLNKKGQQHINQMVDEYNMALGINPDAQPHKKIGIFKIINDSISPLLTPKPGMQQRRNTENLDENDLNVQYLKSKIQQNKLEQMQRAQLHSIQALLGSLRALAMENGDFGFINDIVARITPNMAQKMKTGMSANR